MATNPAKVAVCLCDLLQMFPAAATTGVQWVTLAKKYEERCGAPLNLAALGHDNALSAATALLWEVLHVVNSEDVDNPVVAVEEGVVLTPRPGYLACWPSLYCACSEVVKKYGTVQDESRCLLLAQLKPYLQQDWHSNFNEYGVSYFSEQGKLTNLKKMKHLLMNMLKWRSEYLEERSGTRSGRLSELDSALAPNLVLEQSKTRNDWVLRLAPEGAMIEAQSNCTEKALSKETLLPAGAELERPVAREDAACDGSKMLWSDIDTCELDDRWSDLASTISLSSSPSSAGRSASSETLRELAALRAENARLKKEKDAMEHRSLQADGIVTAMFHVQAGLMLHGSQSEELEGFDDPFEPPRACWSGAGSVSTSPGPSAFCLSAIGTPCSYSTSGAATPALNLQGTPLASGFALPGSCAFVLPMSNIPNGIVKQARSFFERADGAVPSFFARP